MVRKSNNSMATSMVTDMVTHGNACNAYGNAYVTHGNAWERALSKAQEIAKSKN